MSLSGVSKLSVLDLCPVLSGATAADALRNTLDLARFADEQGYERYWLAEHHNMGGIASSSPEIMIGHVAQVTSRIRVGSGGIMLPNHPSLRVAENFLTLEALHPGRIDLGLGRAPGTGTRAALALRRSEGRLRADDFPEQLSDLIGFLEGSLPEDHPFKSVVAMPSNVGMPEIWILGSSDFGARLAAERGLGFAFAQHFSPLPANQVLALYRELFQPSKFLAAPRAIVASHVICAETDEKAEELAMPSDYTFNQFRQTGRSEPLISVEQAKALNYSHSDWQHIRASGMPKFVGSPATLREELTEFLKDTRPDELMITTMIHDHAARLRSYGLLAELFSSG